MPTVLPPWSRAWIDALAPAPRRPVPGRRLRDPALTVRAGGKSWPVLRCTARGFCVADEDVPRLRGLVDLYDGERHVMQCLVVGASAGDGEIVYEFKRATLIRDAAPVDFEIDA